MFNIINRQGAEVPGFKIVRAWIKKISFLFLMSSNSTKVFGKLHDPLTDPLNSASLFYKMMISRLYGHLSENQISHFKLDKLTDYLSQTSQYGKQSFVNRLHFHKRSTSSLSLSRLFLNDIPDH